MRKFPLLVYATLVGLSISILATSPIVALAQTATAPAVAVVDTATNDAPVTATTAVVVQSDTAVTIPYASWVDQVFKLIHDLGVALLPFAATALIAMLPAPIRMIAGPFLQKQANSVLDKALEYGHNAVKGAVQGETLTVPVGNKVLAHAVQYFIESAPKLAEKLGGVDGVAQKIFARLNIPKTAGIEDFPIKPATGAASTKAQAKIFPQLRG